MKLKDKSCTTAVKGTLALDKTECEKLLKQLDKNWKLTNESTRLRREFKFKNFKKPWKLLNLIAELSEEQKHHPEISFGWGHLEVEIWSHNIGGLVESDFILSAKIDELLQKYA